MTYSIYNRNLYLNYYNLFYSLKCELYKTNASSTNDNDNNNDSSNNNNNNKINKMTNFMGMVRKLKFFLFLYFLALSYVCMLIT